MMGNQTLQYLRPLKSKPFGTSAANITNAANIVTSNTVDIGDRIGALTLGFEPTVNSGTAVDVTVEAQVKLSQSTKWLGDNGNEWMLIGTIVAAQITNGEGIFFKLTKHNDWSWFKEIKFRLTGAAGTYDIDFEVHLEGH